ncbi:MAG: right-handed parallel beta-helix repeat-containing protein [Candidatus Woesearchaeota archaeon]
MLEKRDRWLIGILIALPLVLALVFLGNNFSLFESNVSNSNFLTGAAVTNIIDEEFNTLPVENNSNLTEDEFTLGIELPIEEIIIEPLPINSGIEIQGTASSTACGTVDTNLILTQNVSSTANCFTISAPDLTLDCAENWIYYGTTGIGYGVTNAAGHDNITIQNCNIKKNSTLGATNYGIYFDDSFNSTILNNTIYTNGTSTNYGIYLASETNHTVVINNTIFTDGSSSSNVGIYVLSSGNNNYTGNTINTNGTSGNSGAFLQGDYLNFSNNTILTNGKTGGSDYGLYLSAVKWSFIDGNFVLTNGTTSNYAFYVTNSNNNIISNSTFFATGSGNGNFAAYFSNSPNNNLTQNVIRNSGLGTNRGVYITSNSDNLFFNNNTILTFGTADNNEAFIIDSVLTSLENNYIRTNGVNGNNGIEIFSNRNSSRIINNTIITGASGNTNLGFQIYGGYTNITGNIIMTNGTYNNYGFDLRGSGIVTGNQIINNTIITTGSAYSNYGLHIGQQIYTKIINNTIITNGTQSSHAYFLDTDSNGTEFEGNDITATSTGFDMYIIRMNSPDHNFTNEIIRSSGYRSGDDGIVFYPPTERIRMQNVYIEVNDTPLQVLGNNNWFINNTFNTSSSFYLKADSCPSNVCNLYFYNSIINSTNSNVNLNYRMHYTKLVSVNVSNETGQPVQGVFVEGYNVLNEVDSSDVTNSSGRVDLYLSEYYLNGGVQYFISTDHTINTSKIGYLTNTSYLDIYNKTDFRVNISIHKFSCGDTIYSNFNLGQNYSCSSSWLTVGGNSISIIGNNYLVEGTLSAIGATLTNVQGITIKYLTLKNFTTGIQLSSANSSYFYNLNITNMTTGISFIQSNQNFIFHSNIDNGTQAAATSTNSGNTMNCFINTTIDLNNVTISGTAQICKGWYVPVNISFNQGIPLPYANVTAFFNGTTEISDSALTNSNGIAYLKLTENVKNSTGIIDRSMHNITVSFSGLSGNLSNSTVVNVTDNIFVNLSLSLDCTVPADGTNLTNSTVLCPGTYEILDWDQDGVINIANNSMSVTCDNTIIIGDSTSIYYGSAFYAYNRNNITIQNCNVQNFNKAVYFLQTNNSIVNNSQFIGNQFGVYVYNSSFNNFTFLNLSQESVNILRFGAYLVGSSNNTFYNNSFENNYDGIFFRVTTPDLVASENNLIYFNSFRGTSRYDVVGSGSSQNDFNTSINHTGINLTNVGNSWDYICTANLSFSDNDSDGWYDNGSDYPYNLNSYHSYTNGYDYYPQVINCTVVSVVFLNSTATSRSSSSSSSSATISNPSAPPAAAPESAVVSQHASPASTSSLPTTFTAGEGGAYLIKPRIDLNQYISLTERLKSFGYNTKEDFITWIVRNLIMDSQQFSLAYEKMYSPLGTLKKNGGSSFSSIQISDDFSGIAFDVKDKQLDLNEGETIDLDLELGFPGTRSITIPSSISFKGQELQDVELKGNPSSEKGILMKYDINKHIIEIIIVIPSSEEAGTYDVEYNIKELSSQENNLITGAAVVSSDNKSNSISNLDDSFVDYIEGIHLDENEDKILGADLIYDPNEVNGEYVFEAKLFKNGVFLDKYRYDLDLRSESVSIVGKIQAIFTNYWIALIFFGLLFLFFTFYGFFKIKNKIFPSSHCNYPIMERNNELKELKVGKGQFSDYNSLKIHSLAQELHPLEDEIYKVRGKEIKKPIPEGMMKEPILRFKKITSPEKEQLPPLVPSKLVEKEIKPTSIQKEQTSVKKVVVGNKEPITLQQKKLVQKEVKDPLQEELDKIDQTLKDLN